MKHDLESEAKQNEAIRLLAGALASLASTHGHSGLVSVATKVDKLLSGEADPEPPPAAEAPKAELHVTPGPDGGAPADDDKAVVVNE